MRKRFPNSRISTSGYLYRPKEADELGTIEQVNQGFLTKYQTSRASTADESIVSAKSRAIASAATGPAEAKPLLRPQERRSIQGLHRSFQGKKTQGFALVRHVGSISRMIAPLGQLSQPRTEVKPIATLS